MSSYTVRHYTSDDSFTRLINVPSSVREIQVALAFATDYDFHGKSTNGVFKPYWNLEKVTPTVISQFKNLNLPFTVKFFLSIGGRDQRYPFSVTSAEWVPNAVRSLTELIKKYNLDGIDIYYEQISGSGNQFVSAIGELITNLRKNGTITVASIAPSAPLNDSCYLPFYQQYGNYIEFVVYQCHNEENPITTITGLRQLFRSTATQYTSRKLLAGYSNISRDWNTVSPPLYFATVERVVRDGTVLGTSIWTVSDEYMTKGVIKSTDLAPSFEPRWVLELVSSAITHN